ncbi:hypothetical protein DFH09DRAFT_1300273 [Mycena vulgaris]|nr:hypothetical protein DFH09DRAFT_1300273 [Mycena vulgaris]
MPNERISPGHVLRQAAGLRQASPLILTTAESYRDPREILPRESYLGFVPRCSSARPFAARSSRAVPPFPCPLAFPILPLAVRVPNAANARVCACQRVAALVPIVASLRVLPNPPFTFGEASSLALLSLIPRRSSPAARTRRYLFLGLFLSFRSFPIHPCSVRCGSLSVAVSLDRAPATWRLPCARVRALQPPRLRLAHDFTRDPTSSPAFPLSAFPSPVSLSFSFLFPSPSPSSFSPHPQSMHPLILPSQISAPTLSLRAIPDALA